MNDNTHFEIPANNVKNALFKPSGGGISFRRENYSEHGKLLIEKSELIKDIQFKKSDIEFTNDFFIEIESPKEIKVKYAKNNFEKLGFEIINYSPKKDNVATAKINKDNFSFFEEKLNKYAYEKSNPCKSYISLIEDIRDIPIEEKIGYELNIKSNEEVDIIISLYNVLTSKEKKAIMELIQKDLHSNNINNSVHNFINGLTVISCTIEQDKLKKIFNNYSTIRHISKNHFAIIEQSVTVQDLPDSITILPPISNSSIGIIDNGIESLTPIFDGLISDRIPYLPYGCSKSPTNHGTFVASRCLFGDNIDNCLIEHKLEPYCKVVDIPVFGINSFGLEVPPSELYLMKALENIIPKISNSIKVFNISLGYDNSISDNTYSELAKFIDFLSKQYGVLFVISSGNIKRQLGIFPKEHFNNINSRINSPAESLLSITVGSIAKFESDKSLSKTNQLSPFSKIGPGADGGIKPEIVAHGGNLAIGYSQIPRLSAYGISNDGKKLSVDSGTSFSAPIISQYAQKLFDLYPNSDANLIKALLFHFSNSINYFNDIDSNLIFFSGFGEPNIEKALYSGKYSGTFIYEGKLGINNYQTIKFHVPSILSDDNPDTKLKIKITLVYDPITNLDNDLEYSSSRISVFLEKPTIKGLKKVSISTDEKYNLPWNPIIKFEKSFSKKFLTGEWFLKLRLFTRNINIDDYQQNYSVVIEIIDENNKVDVYNAILNEHGSIYNKIMLKVAA